MLEFACQGPDGPIQFRITLDGDGSEDRWGTVTMNGKPIPLQGVGPVNALQNGCEFIQSYLKGLGLDHLQLAWD